MPRQSFVYLIKKAQYRLILLAMNILVFLRLKTVIEDTLTNLTNLTAITFTNLTLLQICSDPV